MTLTAPTSGHAQTPGLMCWRRQTGSTFPTQVGVVPCHFRPKIHSALRFHNHLIWLKDVLNSFLCAPCCAGVP